MYKNGKMFSKVTTQRELNKYLGRHPSETARELHFYKTLVKYMGNTSALETRKEVKTEKQQWRGRKKTKTKKKKNKKKTKKRSLEIL